MENKRSCKVCFGLGFRKIDPSVSAVGFNPAVREKEIAVEIDPGSKLCIEITGEDSDICYRDRSDISMLLHAKDTANKLGLEGLRYLSESRRTKTSAIQSQLDQMDDQLLLDTVKSRHLQSPAEILAWSESLTQVAHDLEIRAGTEAREKHDKEIAAAAAAQSSDSSGSSDSAE